jgi:hypothetical protein
VPIRGLGTRPFAFSMVWTLPSADIFAFERQFGQAPSGTLLHHLLVQSH